MEKIIISKKNNQPVETPQGFYLFCPKHKKVHLFSPKTSKKCKESLSVVLST